MATIYTTEKKFKKISKGLEQYVHHYPNPDIKELNGIKYEIVPSDIRCTIQKLDREHYTWFLGMDFEEYKKFIEDVFNDDDPDVYKLEVSSCWFPVDLIAGIKDGRYSIHSKLSEKTGYLTSHSSSNIVLIRASKIQNAVKILNKNHFKFNINEINK